MTRNSSLASRRNLCGNNRAVTHEERLMGLLQRKLRPVKYGERLISIAFEDWSREGPVFREKRTEYVGSEEKVLAA